MLCRFVTRLAVGGVWEEDGELWTPGRRADRAVAPARPDPGAAGVIGYLGLGSNVGDRRANLQAAVDALPAPGVGCSPRRRSTTPSRSAMCSTSPTSSTPACGSTPSSGPSRCSTRARRSSASSAGCAGGVRHGPRPIDVDLLLLGDERYRSERLTLPHEEVTSRRFVLVPLLELAPDLEVPGCRARRRRARRARPGGRGPPRRAAARGLGQPAGGQHARADRAGADREHVARQPARRARVDQRRGRPRRSSAAAGRSAIWSRAAFASSAERAVGDPAVDAVEVVRQRAQVGADVEVAWRR